MSKLANSFRQSCGELRACGVNKENGEKKNLLSVKICIGSSQTNKHNCSYCSIQHYLVGFREKPLEAIPKERPMFDVKGVR